MKVYLPIETGDPYDVDPLKRRQYEEVDVILRPTKDLVGAIARCVRHAEMAKTPEASKWRDEDVALVHTWLRALSDTP
jgi:hypothetical protein